MKTQQEINYNRIAEAIEYIKTNFKGQPDLEEVAEQIHLSPFHFQRLFSEWAGTTPKKFLQYISVQHAKAMLREKQATLFETAAATGLSGTGRLHDLFIKIEGMTPAEYKNGGENLHIHYHFSASPFGHLIIASTAKGICYMAFEENPDKALVHLKQQFPHAHFRQQTDAMQQNALSVFQNNGSEPAGITLHLKGSSFQLKVWEALLNIPMGQLTTYGNIARQTGNPKASRAVGTAIGSNPVAYLIPCHRVIQSSGIIGGYMWGSTRKTAIIGWECAQVDAEI